MASAGRGDADSEDEQPDPRTKLMQEVADEMDQIEADYGDDYQIGRVVTIVEVVRPNGEVGLRVRAGQLPWVTLGMLHFAEKVLESQIPGSQ